MKPIATLLFAITYFAGFAQFSHGDPIAVGNPLEVSAGIRGAVEFTFQSAVGKYYQLQISPDLQSWDNESYSIKGTGGQLRILASNRNYSARAFYRLRDDGDPNNVAPVGPPGPTGAVVAFAGTSAPSGWFLCDGSAISRTDYAALFSVVGTSFGQGDGSTTFNLPNLKGRVPVGLSSTDPEFNTLGESGGAKTHALTIDEIPAHTHWLRAGVSWGTGDGGSNLATASGSSRNQITSSSGGGAAHSILQPYLVLQYIIKY